MRRAAGPPGGGYVGAATPPCLKWHFARGSISDIANGVMRAAQFILRNVEPHRWAAPKRAGWSFRDRPQFAFDTRPFAKLLAGFKHARCALQAGLEDSHL